MWNNQIQTSANWAGSGNNNAKQKSLTVDNLNASSIYAYYAGITYISSSVLATGFINLNSNIITAIDGILYVDGVAFAVPSTLSSIADWSYFPALTNVNMNNSTIKNALGISTNYLTASNIQNTTLNNTTLNNTTINNTTLNNTNINSRFINGRNLNVSTINTRSISSINISTGALKASYADIPFVKTSTLEFETALGRDMAISSMILNRSIYIPDDTGSDAFIIFFDSTFTETYGAITTGNNRSTFLIGSANDLALVGQSSIKMLGNKVIELNTIRDDIEPTYIQLNTNAVVIDADLILTQAAMSTNSITADSIDTRIITADTYINIPSSFINTWSYYPALSTVHAELDLFNLPQYDIKDFRNINGNTINGKVVYSPLQPTIPIGGTVNADISVNAPTGNFDVVAAEDGFIDTIQTDHIDIGNTLTEIGDMNIYGSLLPPGDNALLVEGGTTLSGAGLVHGVSIGAQTVGGINLQRIDVLPTNIDIISDTFITIDAVAFANVAAAGAVSIAAGGATSVAAGGALSLAGGSYIEYDTDQNYFINTSAGNDYTDIYVGNIHGAIEGTDQLRINDNRGVKLDNVTEINLRQNFYDAYNSNILYNENDLVELDEIQYVSLLSNRNINPTSTIAVFNSTIGYDIGNFVLSTPTVAWNCISTINIPYTRSTPSISLSSVWTAYEGVSTVNQIWGTYTSPGVSKIIGDNNSYLNIGKISTIHLSTNDIYSKSIYTQSLGNPNPIVPTPIAINNALDLQGNDILNVNNLYASNIDIANINVSSISTTYITVTTIYDSADTGIAFYNYSNVGKGVIQATDNALLMTGTENVQIGALSNITIQAFSNAEFGGNTAAIGGISTLFLYTASTLRVQAELGFFDIQGGIQTQGISTQVTIAGLGYVERLYAEGISTNTLSTSFMTSKDIYATNIYADALGSSNGFIITPLLVNNALNLQGNNIFNVTTLTSENISTNNLSTGSFFTGLISTLSLNTSTITTNTINVNTLTSSNISTNNISSGTFFTGLISTLRLNTSSITTNTISGVNGGLFLNGFVSSQSIRVSTIVTSNIFTSSIRTSVVETNTGTAGSSNSRFDYISTASVRTNILQSASGIGAVTTFSLTPIDVNQSLGTFPTPFFFGYINNLSNNNLSSGTIIGGSINVSSVRANTITGTSTIFTSTLRASRIETNTGGGAGVFNSAFDYVSTASVRTNFLQGATGGGSVVTYSLQPINNTQVLNTNINVPWAFASITNTSTQNLVVSTINNKTYPYTSTLNVFPTTRGVSTFKCDGNIATTPQILLSNITFPTLGNYLVTSKMTVSKATGGAGAEPYGSLCLSRGRFPSTFNTQDGFNALPYLNAVNKSTFNTFTTSISITDNNLRSRFLTYYDTTGHNYTIDMAIADFRIRYFPGSGNLPDTGIS